jgi:hypothetical protein
MISSSLSPGRIFMSWILRGSPGFNSIWLYRLGLCSLAAACLMVHSAQLSAQQNQSPSSSPMLALVSPTPTAISSSQQTGTPDPAQAATTNVAEAATSAHEISGSANPPPDAPKDPTSTTNTTKSDNQDQRQQQTKRILDIMPNFRAVSTDEQLPPQSVKVKFVTATEDSFDYSSIFIPLMLTAYDMEIDATPEFHQGAAGFARYFWHNAVDQTSENYMVEFVVPSITHEDTRYYTLGRGGIFKRTGYALSRAVVTRSDAGNDVFNASEVLGAGASAGLSSLYYPSRERSLTNTGTEWGLDVAIDAASFVFKEFWPDINHKLFHATQSSDGSVH